MSKLGKLRSKLSESTFNEAKVSRDEKGRFAPKDAAKQIASKTKRIKNKEKDFDALLEEVFQEQFKLYKEDGSYKHIILNNGKKYDEILKSHGKKAADKAYEDAIRESAKEIVQELKKKAVIEDERTNINKGKNKQLKRELSAFERFYPHLKYQSTLQEFKDKNPDINLLSRLDAEEKLDKQLSHDSIMNRGEKHIRKLDTKLFRAKSEQERLKIMEDYRAGLIKNGMPRQDAVMMVNSKRIESSRLGADNEIIASSATEFYQIARGAGNSTLDTLKAKSFRAYANKQDRVIDVGVFAEPRTVYHEMGHHIEYEDSRIATASREWRDKRATGVEQPLNNLVKDGRYDDDEIAKPGNYINPYVGKVYRDGSTEVISMGIERFHSSQSMLDFYNEDREHFQFIMGVIRRD
ncbi:hypothetical protein [Aetokthonos hydrillicola]|uniref:hypothetical protein n=1 Tax=Aetokthonos hydrillicola TaxID=1550245 RepID=UPI001B09FCBB|nr:hypothetical protein [Aetokthonos hydrillicola CCALA 1050]MBW4584078.1 hypothetical protein [Aetokthonos hydrillicola CCALA 1050]